MSHERQYAGLASRFFALVIDFALFCAVFFPTTRIVKGVWLMRAADHEWREGWFVFDPICLVFLIVIFAYFFALEGLAGMTLGKWALGLRVVGPDHHKPGLKKGLLRNLLRLVDALPVLNILGVVLILSSPEGARFGDRVARTRVIRM